MQRQLFYCFDGSEIKCVWSKVKKIKTDAMRAIFKSCNALIACGGLFSSVSLKCNRGFLCSLFEECTTKFDSSSKEGSSTVL